ncbi:MAG: hypothetical protein KME08_20075 [Aphanothece sp. CMT-3BRIN-NPC111]|nr:hypothetical protein [Aphanothece sp. CMT-3BRIN-NPC111]
MSSIGDSAIAKAKRIGIQYHPFKGTRTVDTLSTDDGVGISYALLSQLTCKRFD